MFEVGVAAVFRTDVKTAYTRDLFKFDRSCRRALAPERGAIGGVGVMARSGPDRAEGSSRRQQAARRKLECSLVVAVLAATLCCRDAANPSASAAGVSSEKSCADQLRGAASTSTDPLVRARATRALGLCLGAIESSEKAASLLDRAAAAFAAAGAAEEQAKTLLALGLEQSRIGRPEDAERALATALDQFEEMDQPAGTSQAHLLLGDLFQNTGSFERALTHFKSARDIATMAGLADQQSRALQRMGSFFTLIGYSEEALDYLSQALILQRELGLDEDRIDTLAAIGWAHYLDLEARDALPYYSEALALAQATDNRSAVAGLLDRVGSAYRKLGRLDDAETAYRRSLELSRQLERPAWQAHTLSNLGRLMLVREEPRAALPLLTESLRLMNASGDLNGAVSVRLDEARALRRLDRDDEALGCLEEALANVEALRSALVGEASRMQFVGARYDVYEEMIDLLFEQWEETGSRDHLHRALEMTERARARGLVEGLGTAPLLETAREREEAIRVRQLAAMRRTASAKYEHLFRRGASADAIDDVERELRRLTLEIDEQRSRLLEQIEPEIVRSHVTWESIADLAEPGTVILVYSLGSSRSFVFAVGAGRVDGFVLPHRAQIESQVRATIRSIEGSLINLDDRREVPRRLASLARMTLSPAADRLDANTVVVVPDGGLAYFPFDILPRPHPRNGRVALKAEPILVRSEVVMLPSISVLALQRRLFASRPTAPRPLLVFADPVYTAQHPAVAGRSQAGNGSTPSREELATRSLERVRRDFGIDRLTDLPHSATEANRISRHCGEEDPALVLLGPDASRARFFSSELGRFRNIHFAGHGLFDSINPDLSGLIFSLRGSDGGSLQGLVHPRELRDLELNAELITLSACRTAWGTEVRGEGLLGVTRGLLYAGARRVLVSSWSVEDAATAELMDRFYAAYLGQGETPVAALRTSKLSMRDEPAWSIPAYWGAFSLHGDWH